MTMIIVIHQKEKNGKKKLELLRTIIKIQIRIIQIRILIIVILYLNGIERKKGKKYIYISIINDHRNTKYSQSDNEKNHSQ